MTYQGKMFGAPEHKRTTERQSQGQRANRSGHLAEMDIVSMLENRGFKVQRQVYIGDSIFGHPTRVDMIAYVPPYPEGVIIESKYQDTPGSADEKLCYLVENIKEKYPLPTIIVHDMDGAKAGAVKWLYAKVGSPNLVAVMSFTEFKKWVNRIP